MVPRGLRNCSPDRTERTRNDDPEEHRDERRSEGERGEIGRPEWATIGWQAQSSALILREGPARDSSQGGAARESGHRGSCLAGWQRVPVVDAAGFDRDEAAEETGTDRAGRRWDLSGSERPGALSSPRGSGNACFVVRERKVLGFKLGARPDQRLARTARALTRGRGKSCPR